MNWEEAVKDMKINVIQQMMRVIAGDISLIRAAAEVGMIPSEFIGCYESLVTKK